MYVLCHDLDGRPFSFECDGPVSLKEQIEKRTSLPAGSFRVVSANGGRLELLSSALNVVSIRLGLCGGKGGFGSLLRGGNTSVNRKKSSNYDSSRDLSGRRLLHISNERKLAEWFAGSESREMEAKGADFLKRMEREKQMVEFESHFKEQSDRVKDMIAGALDTLDPAVIASLGPEKKNKNKRDREDAPVSLSNSSEGRPRKRFCTGLDELDTDVLDEEDDVDQTETVSELPDQKKSIPSPEAPSSDSMTPSPPLTTSPDPVEKTEENKGIDLTRFESAKDLEALGLEALKNELTRLGLLCGGTLEQRATRLFSTKNKKPSEFDPSIITKKKPALRKF